MKPKLKPGALIFKESYKIEDLNKYRYTYFIEVQKNYSVVITKLNNIVFYNIRINTRKSQNK